MAVLVASTEVAAADEIRFTVPASPRYLRLVRLLAAGVAARAGLDLDQIDDLRIAIDEVCFALVGDTGRDGTVTVSYEAVDGSLMVVGEANFTEGMGHQPRLSPLSKQILDATVDECVLEPGPNGPCFRLVKRRE